MFNRFFELTKDVPKVVGPREHAVLDHLTTAAFMLMGAAYWGRHKRATAVALINGFLVFGLTLLTDYDGDGRRPISFRTHADVDVIQAILAASMPAILGFGGSRAAIPFRLQAVNEMVVVSVTDFERKNAALESRLEQAA